MPSSLALYLPCWFARRPMRLPFKQTMVGGQGLWTSTTHPRKVRLRGIEKIIEFAGHHRAGYAQDALRLMVAKLKMRMWADPMKSNSAQLKYGVGR